MIFSDVWGIRHNTEIYDDLYYSQEDADSDVEEFSIDQEQPSNVYLSHGGVEDHENITNSQTAHV